MGPGLSFCCGLASHLGNGNAAAGLASAATRGGSSKLKPKLKLKLKLKQKQKQATLPAGYRDKIGGRAGGPPG